jgi:hypothetical protein
MFAYRERRLRAPAIAGVAEVQFLTAGLSEFKADLRDARGGRVRNCSTGARRARMRIELMPVSTSTPEMHGGNFAP